MWVARANRDALVKDHSWNIASPVRSSIFEPDLWLRVLVAVAVKKVWVPCKTASCRSVILASARPWPFRCRYIFSMGARSTFQLVTKRVSSRKRARATVKRERERMEERKEKGRREKQWKNRGQRHSWRIITYVKFFYLYWPRARPRKTTD